jgi:hypothetical protein
MSNGIIDQLCPPLPEESEESIGLKRVFEAVISSHVLNLEGMLGLQEPNPRFRSDLAEAVLICTLTARWPPQRPSLKRKELLNISEDAAAFKEIGCRLASRLQQTSSIYEPIRDQFLRVARQASEFASLSSMARAHAKMFIPDRGGPRGMIAFRELVKGLARTFEGAIGRPAWEAAKYRGEKGGHEGLFIDFVQAVLPIVRNLAPDMPLPDGRLAEDTYAFEVVSSLRRSRKGKLTKRKRSPKPPAHSKPTKTKRQKRGHTA